LRILLIDDDNISREMMADYLDGLLGHEVVQCNGARIALDKYKENPFSLVISDIKMPEINGIELLHEIKKLPEGKRTKVILITGYAEVDTAVQALREGAYDYMLKPIDVSSLDSIIENIEQSGQEEFNVWDGTGNGALEQDKLSETDKYYNNQKYLNKISGNQRGAYLQIGGMNDFSGIKIGIFSKPMKDLVSTALKFHEDRSIPVLIEGESGTGKEIFMKIIHYGSKEDERPLVSLNCSAISPNLFESELFGYEGGTFTGSKSRGMIGKLELAQGGTIFLDEIGDMPLEMQPKLLRVLQERSFYKVGGLKKIGLDVRFIAATNKNLKILIENGSFRQDLYHRINIGLFYLIPLKNQPEAIIPLAEMFLLEFANQRNKQFRLIHRESSLILEKYSWPGNIRELRNVIERIVLLYDEIELLPKHLSFLNMDGINYDTGKFELTDDSFILPDDSFNLENIEIAIIKKAVEKFNGNQTKAAQYLGISRGTLRNKLKI
jgi:two-component system, NtrC family, response regulator AtoC